MNSCVMCGTELLTPLDEFGDNKHPVCREHWFEYGEDRNSSLDIDVMDDLLHMPVAERLEEWEFYLRRKQEELESTQAINDGLKKLMNEIEYSEQRIAYLRKKRDDRKKREAVR